MEGLKKRAPAADSSFSVMPATFTLRHPTPLLAPLGSVAEGNALCQLGPPLLSRDYSRIARSAKHVLERGGGWAVKR